MKKLFFLQMIVALVIFNSCEKKEFEEKDNAMPNSEVVLKNGTLSFQTVDAFFEVADKLGAMSDMERQNWENSIGFVSLRTELLNVFVQINMAENENEVEEIVANNSDIVEFVDGEVCPIIKSNSYATVANRKGIFFVEGVIHKVEGGKIASSEDGKEQTVTNALCGNQKSIEKGVNVVEYIDGSSFNRGNCGNRKSAYIEIGKRKCDFEMKTYKYYCKGCCGNYYYRVIAEATIKNYKKRWGGWKSYNTACTMKERGYTIEVPEVTGYNGYNTTFYYRDVTHTFGVEDSNYDCARMTRWSYVGDRVQNIGIKTPTFSRVKGKASNRGVGDNWAEINCGAW